MAHQGSLGCLYFWQVLFGLLAVSPFPLSLVFWPNHIIPCLSVFAIILSLCLSFSLSLFLSFSLPLYARSQVQYVWTFKSVGLHSIMIYDDWFCFATMAVEIPPLVCVGGLSSVSRRPYPVPVSSRLYSSVLIMWYSYIQILKWSSFFFSFHHPFLMDSLVLFFLSSHLCLCWYLFSTCPAFS